MRFLEWLKSLSGASKDRTDIIVSQWVFTHKREYNEFKESLYRIKDGDGRAYQAMYALLLDCLSEKTKKIYLHLFAVLTGGKRNKVSSILKGLKKDITPEIGSRYANYVEGKMLAWNVKTGEIGFLTNENEVRLSDFVIISKQDVSEHWQSLPIEIRTYFKKQIRDFVNFYHAVELAYNAGSNFRTFKKGNNSLSADALSQWLQTIADYLVVVLFCGMPETYANLKSKAEGRTPLAMCAYRFVRKDHGLMQLSKILSSFFKGEAGNTGLYLIRNAMRYMAKYDIGEGQTKSDEWIDMLSEPAAESQKELRETLACIVKCMKSRQGRKSADAISLEEMIEKSITADKFMMVINNNLAKYKDEEHLAILFTMLEGQNFLRNDLSGIDKSFILMLKEELNISINERGFYKKRKLLKEVLEDRIKKRSYARSEYFVIEDEWLPRFNGTIE